MSITTSTPKPDSPHIEATGDPVRVVVRSTYPLTRLEALTAAWPVAAKHKGWPLKLQRIPGYVCPFPGVYEVYFIEEES